VAERGLTILLADLLLVTHALFIAFVVLGQIAILVGLLTGRAWARDLRLRLIHLVCVLFVVLQTWLGMTCPLTIGEHDLRIRAGQTGYELGFVATWLQRLVFYDAEPWVFNLVYSLFGLVVVATWVFGRPRRRAG
jgi:hypothetical protein